MPPARSSSSAASTRAREARRTRPSLRSRWDRRFRTVMLCVLALVGWIGLKAMLALVATHAQAQQETGLVASLRRQNRALEQQQRQLSQRGTIIRDARALGMVRAGEKAYVVTGLPGGR